MHSPSYPHIPSAGGDQHLLHSNGGGGRPRPVSMYDTPPSSGGGGGERGGGGFSFIPSLLMPNRSKGQAPAAPPPHGYNASAPASLQHQFYGKNQQQQPKKGQIMRQGPGELVRP